MATLFTFGSGSRGELGLPRADDKCRPEATAVAFPPEVLCKSSGEADISSIALGTDHSLSVVRGNVFRWGLLCTRSPPRWSSSRSTSGGEVVPTPAPLEAWTAGQPGGDGSSDEHRLDGQVCSVSCGGSNSFMLTKDGEVFLFGDLRPPGGDAGRPRWLWGHPLKGAGERVARIAAGWRHCLLLTEAGSLFALGDDEHGQCAGVNAGDVAVPLPTTQRALGVSAGACHSVAWDCSGTAFTWGHGGCGRLGLGGLQHRRSPTQVDALQEPVFLASCGANFTLFATSRGRALWACGGNQYGQLGLGDVSSSPTDVPQQLDLPRGNEEIISLACGMHHVLCLTRLAAAPGQPIERSVAWAWGCAVSGQCGRAAGERRGSAPPQCRTAPEPLVDFLAPSPHWPLAVAAGRSHSAVLAQTRPSPASFAQTSAPVNGMWSASPSGLNGVFSKLQQPLSPVLDSPSPHFDSGNLQTFQKTAYHHHYAEQDAVPHKTVVHDDIIDQFCASLAPSTAAPSGRSSTHTMDFHLSSPTPQVLMQSPVSSEPILEREPDIVPDAGHHVAHHPEGLVWRAVSPLRSPAQGMMVKGGVRASPGSPGTAHPVHPANPAQSLVARSPSAVYAMPPKDRLRRSMSEVALLVELGEAVLRGEDEDESVGPSQNGWDEREPAYHGEHVWDQTGMVRSASAAQLRTWNGKTYIHGGRGKPAKTSNPSSRRASMDLEDRRPKTVVTGVRGRATVVGLTGNGQHGATDRRKPRWPAAPQSWGRPEEVQRAPRRSASAVELQRSRHDGRSERSAGYAHSNGYTAAARASRRSSKHDNLQRPDQIHATMVCTCGNHFLPDSAFCRKCGARRPSVPVMEEPSHMQMPFGNEVAMPGSPHDLFADSPAAEGFALEAAADARKNVWQAPHRTSSPPAEFLASRWSQAQPASPPAEVAVWQWPVAQLASPSRELQLGRCPSMQMAPQVAGAAPVGFSPMRNPLAEPRRDEWSGVHDSLNDLTSMIANMKAPGSGGLGTGLSFGLTGRHQSGFTSNFSMDFGGGVTNGTVEHSTSRRAEADDEIKSPPQQGADGDASDAGIIFSPTDSDAAASSRRTSTDSRRGAVGRRRQNGRRMRAGRARQRDALKREIHSSDRSGAATKMSLHSSTSPVSASGFADVGFMVTQPAALSPRPQVPQAGLEAERAADQCRECGTVFIPESNFCMKCGSRRPAKTLADAHPASVYPAIVSPASVFESSSPSQARIAEAAAPTIDATAGHVQHETFASTRAHHLHPGTEPASVVAEADRPAHVQHSEPFVMGAPLGHDASRLSDSGGLAAEHHCSNVGSSPASTSFLAPESPAHKHQADRSGHCNSVESSHREVTKEKAAHGSSHGISVESSRREVSKEKASHGADHGISVESSRREITKEKALRDEDLRAKAEEAVFHADILPNNHDKAEESHHQPSLMEDIRHDGLVSGAMHWVKDHMPGHTHKPAEVHNDGFASGAMHWVKDHMPGHAHKPAEVSSVDASSHHNKAGKPMEAPEPRAGAKASAPVLVQPQRQFSDESSADSSSPSPRKPAAKSAPQPVVLSANDDSSEEEAVQPMVLSAHGSSSEGEDGPMLAGARRLATAVPAESPRQTGPRFVKPAAAPAEDVVPFSDADSSGQSSSEPESLSPHEKLQASSVAAAAVHATASAMNESDGSSSSHDVRTRGVQPRRDSSASGSSTGGSSDDEIRTRADAIQPAAPVTVLRPVSPGSSGSGSSSGADSSPGPGKRPASQFAPAAPKPAPTGPPIGAPPVGLRKPPEPVTTMLQSFSSGEDLDVEDISD